MIHVEEPKKSRLIRWYTSGSYEEKSKYSAVCNLVHVDENTAIIEGLCGNINHKFWVEIRQIIIGLGYTSVKIFRHGHWKTITTD